MKNHEHEKPIIHDKNRNQKEKLLHTKFVDYGKNAKEWTRKCVLLLPEIEKYSIWQKKGFGSIYEYAAKLAGMNKAKVDDALRILNKLENRPKLRAVAETKGLGAVRPVITIATKEDDAFWANKAENMSKNTLETYVKEFKREFRPRTEFKIGESNEHLVKGVKSASRQNEERAVKLTMDLAPKTAEELKKLKGKGDWNTLMQELLELRKKKLTIEEPEPVKTAKRYIPARIKKHVLKKTNGSCAYPGCCKTSQILHHTQRFALQKVHDPAKLKPLCKGHEAIAHQGLIENEQQSTEEWRLRKDPKRESHIYEIDRMVMEFRARK